LNSDRPVPLTRAFFSVSFEGDPNRLTKRRGSAGVGDPEDWVFRGLRIRIAAQVGEINKADWRDVVFGDPLERRADACRGRLS